MPDSIGDSAQVRSILQQIAKATVIEIEAARPTREEAPLPPLMKWLVGAVSALGTACLVGLGIWLVSSVSTMRETLARMDERMLGQDSTRDGKFTEIERRLTRLEGYHARGEQ